MLNKTPTTDIAWSKALSTLSSEAFYLLAILHYKNFYITDETLMEFTNLGVSSHRKYKSELIKAGYLSIKQIGKGVYHYTIKDVSNG